MRSRTWKPTVSSVTRKRTAFIEIYATAEDDGCCSPRLSSSQRRIQVMSSEEHTRTKIGRSNLKRHCSPILLRLVSETAILVGEDGSMETLEKNGYFRYWRMNRQQIWRCRSSPLTVNRSRKWKDNPSSLVSAGDRPQAESDHLSIYSEIETARSCH